MVRTRIAPSPTGEDLHIGNLYTALFNWAYARQNKGGFIVRIEDTDQKRRIEKGEERILKTLADFGLTPDESPTVGGPYKPYRQSERLEIYKKYAQELVGKGAAYKCCCTPERLAKLRESQQKQKKPAKYDKHCCRQDISNKPYVIRLNVPEGRDVSFEDIVRGTITFNTNDIDDQILIKSDGFPTYHMAVVVDDYLMKISHVIRGEEWISSTPKHILLYEAFGWDAPIFTHLPILRNPDRSKLSKRRNPVWASWYLEQGFLPEAVLNYLALMGWSHPDEKETFSLQEFVETLDFKRISSSGPVFDVKKLEWMSGEYIRRLKTKDLGLKLFEFFQGKYSKDLVENTVPLIQERIKTLKEYDAYCSFFIKRPKEYDMDISKHKELFNKIYRELEKLDADPQAGGWKAEKIGEVLMPIAKESGLSNSKFFMLLRVAITGRKITPPLNESMEILGKEETLSRLKLV
ncbi:MAG: glutamate--tRNA ligase [Candidatus Paceibacterota bacterium]